MNLARGTGSTIVAVFLVVDVIGSLAIARKRSPENCWMLNRRHKAVLFLTLVMTGSSLLAGATLTEAVGMLMLGGALAWLVGSEAVVRAYQYVRTLPGIIRPWLRTLLLMLLGGCLLVGVAVWSNFNSFVVVASMSIFGMPLSSLLHFPTERRWLQVISWILAIVVFFFAVVATAMLSGTPDQNMERMGQLAAYGLIALPVGLFWLAKGWRLVLAGITAEQPLDATQTANRGTRWLYVSLFLGAIILTLVLGLLGFAAFTDSVFPSQAKVTAKPSNPQSPFSAPIFLALLAWWPYASWKSILKREPNTVAANVKRHKRVTTVLGALFTVILSVAITFGIQNGYDRIATIRLEDGMKDFKDVADKIGAIKGRDLQTTKDYIDAYAEMEPLQVEYDNRLRAFTDFLSEAKQKDKNRGPINIQHLYSKHKEWLVWDDEIADLLRQGNELTKQEVLAAKQMASLPESYQPKFWQKNFRPLLEEEATLRQKIESLQRKMPE